MASSLSSLEELSKPVTGPSIFLHLLEARLPMQEMDDFSQFPLPVQPPQNSVSITLEEQIWRVWEVRKMVLEEKQKNNNGKALP